MSRKLKPKNYLTLETTAEDAAKVIALEQKIAQRDLELDRRALENKALQEQIWQFSATSGHQRQIEQGMFEIERERFAFLRGILNRLVWTFIAALAFTALSLALGALGVFELDPSQKDILSGAILAEVAGLVIAAMGAFSGARKKLNDEA